MRNTVRKLLSLVVLGALACSLVLMGGGCSEPQATEELAESGAESATVELRTIGEESETTVALEITNITGKEIIGLAVKRSEDTAYGKSLLSRSTALAEDETVVLYLDPAALAEATRDAAASSGATSGAASGAEVEAAADSGGTADVLLRTLYHVSLTFSDDTTAELHDLNLEELTVISLCLSSDDIAYIEFIDEEGKEMSTLETERALKRAAEEAAAAAQQAEADAAALQAQAEADAAAEAAQQQSNGGYSYDTGAGSAGGGSQSEDVCIPESDLILN